MYSMVSLPQAISPSAGASNHLSGTRAYYSIVQAAALMGVSRVSVWRWIRDGQLPAARLGHRTVRIKHEDVERLLARNPSATAASPAVNAGTAATSVTLASGAPHAERTGNTIAGSRFDWTEIGPTDHFVQFYESDEFLVDAVADFMVAGLHAGDAGIVIATPEHRASLESSLEALSVDAMAVCASGQLVVLDAAETLGQFMMDGVPDPHRFEAVVGALVARMVAGGRRVRAFGEMVALLVEEENPEAAIRLEQLWNELGKNYAFSLFCGYSMDGLRGESFTQLVTDVCAEHAHVIPGESYTTVADAGDRLRMVSVLQQKAWTLEAEIAERKRAQAQLQVALEAELRLRDDFISIAAHELKTPLTSLTGHAQLAMRRLERVGHLEPEAVAETLRTIAGQGFRLSRLLAQLLDVSRLEAGRLAPELQPADLATLVEQVVAAARPRSDRHVITMTLPEHLEALVDAPRVEQVLVNLLDNAMKYSPGASLTTTPGMDGGGGGGIEVTLSRTPDGMAELAVRDHGLGIALEKRGQLFERFYQAHGSGHTSGWGLGLYISRQIVEMHGGEIRAEFPADGGTRFVVRLPLTPERPYDGVRED